jgi:ATP-binding cassette subfamily C (CFTR/MRP) protein 1
MQGSLLHIMFIINDTEKLLQKVQKCFDVMKIPQEKNEPESPKQVEQAWPQQGTVEFKDVKLRYRPDTDMVLKGLSFEIQAGHKIGVVGRTGAGKSTMSLALSRIIELEEGSISIDGVDIASIQLQALRNKLTVIPQDPTLFSDSLRKNIDPEGLLDDDKIMSILKKAGIPDMLQSKA